jgi:CopA family copper-resistance protein
LISLAGPTIDLAVATTRVRIGGRAAEATTVNGGVPGPEIRLREGQDAVLRVRNGLQEDTSIHWHGLLVPPGMDGVPGVSFDGIPPGETFVYRFPIRQSGTYWYHSHSGFQEQTGIYGPLVIEPASPEPHAYDREYTIVLSDWTFENPSRVLANLKRYGGYYNFQRRTLANLGDEAGRMGFWSAVSDRFRWARMRMDSTDISDVTGVTYTYLFNGLAPDENWRGIFNPGERVRLRFINASAATYFDVRIPGLRLKVIQADGMNVSPVDVDEFRLAIAETLDVLVEPVETAYTVFAEAMDRSGFTRGTLATGPDVIAAIPARRPRPLLTMADMGMDHGAMGGEHAGHSAQGHGSPDAQPATAPSGHASMSHEPSPAGPTQHQGHNMARKCSAALAVVSRHGDDEHGAGNAMVAAVARSRVSDPGVGLRDTSWQVLTYANLRRATPGAKTAPEPSREIELHLTGNMERYMWSFDGEQYRHDMAPISLRHGERVRFVLINDTMMAHPIHLHGMFFELEVPSVPTCVRQSTPGSLLLRTSRARLA